MGWGDPRRQQPRRPDGLHDNLELSDPQAAAQYDHQQQPPPQRDSTTTQSDYSGPSLINSFATINPSRKPWHNDIERSISAAQSFERERCEGPITNSTQALQNAQQLLDMCASTLTLVNRASASQRRSLFNCGERALQRMERIAKSHFPLLTTQHTDIEALEYRLNGRPFLSQSDARIFNAALSREEKTQLASASQALSRLQGLQLRDQGRYAAGVGVLQCALGLELTRVVGHETTVMLPAAVEPEPSADLAQRVWTPYKDSIWLFAAWSLIEMASSLAVVCNGQSVALFGTRVPGKCFDGETA